MTYEKVEAIIRSSQQRGANFRGMNACVPDLFATNILIFLSNDGPDSEWAAIRHAVHSFFLDIGNEEYQLRVEALPRKIAEDWPRPTLTDLNDTALLQRTVCKTGIRKVQKLREDTVRILENRGLDSVFMRMNE